MLLFVGFDRSLELPQTILIFFFLIASRRDYTFCILIRSLTQKENHL